MEKMPYCPTQAGYSSTVNDGILRIALDGGRGRYRSDVLGGSDLVDVSWVLPGDDYSLFMGFVRNWIRSGGAPFEIDLPLDSAVMETYVANFIPGSIGRPRKEGRAFFVSAQLEVTRPQDYLDPDLDYWAILMSLLPYYGSIDAITEVFNLLEKLVNHDLPSRP